MRLGTFPKKMFEPAWTLKWDTNVSTGETRHLTDQQVPKREHEKHVHLFGFGLWTLNEMLQQWRGLAFTDDYNLSH